MARAILWMALPMLEIMGCIGRVFGLWILGEPYNVGIVRRCSIREVQVFFHEFFIKSLLKEVTSLLMVIELDIS